MQLFFPHLPPTLFKGKCAFFPRFPEANIHFPFYVIQKLHSAEKSQKRSQKEVRGGRGKYMGRDTLCVGTVLHVAAISRFKPAKKTPTKQRKREGAWLRNHFCRYGKKAFFCLFAEFNSWVHALEFEMKKKTLFLRFPQLHFSKKS